MSTKDPWDKDHWMPGVLSKTQIETLHKSNYIGGIHDICKSVDNSSIDLHISNCGYQLKEGSIKPSGEHSYENVYLKDEKKAKPLKKDRNGFFKLQKNECYVFKLKEKLNNHLGKSNIYGQATAKSTIGRLDVIARLIVDGMLSYESFDSGRLQNGAGEMYLEIIPNSFNIKLKEGYTLSQLRLFFGKIDQAIINDENFIKNILHGDDSGDGHLSVDLTPSKVANLEASAFQALEIKNDYIDINVKNKYDPCRYWALIQSINNRLVIKKDHFYILKSKEKISVPKGVSVYCRAMDETLGEMRIHYAGFVHPYFGLERNDGKEGTPLIFEVRGHNIDVNLKDGERLAKLIFYRMSEECQKTSIAASEYFNQELKLSKVFKAWPSKMKKIANNRVIEQVDKK